MRKCPPVARESSKLFINKYLSDDNRLLFSHKILYRYDRCVWQYHHIGLCSFPMKYEMCLMIHIISQRISFKTCCCITVRVQIQILSHLMYIECLLKPQNLHSLTTFCNSRTELFSQLNKLVDKNINIRYKKLNDYFLSNGKLIWLSVLVSSFNSSPPTVAYMRQWTGTTLVQVMAWHRKGDKPLPEPTLIYCQLDHWEQI